MKLCKHCKYFKPRDFMHPICAFYTIERTDLVWGQTVYENVTTCSWARAQENLCGGEGKQWIRKQSSWWER